MLRGTAAQQGMKYRWTILLLFTGAAPFIGLIYWAEVAQHRSAADLELADRCVDWAHKPRDARTADGPDVATACERYFRVRSDENADEDEKRWEARTNSRMPTSN